MYVCIVKYVYVCIGVSYIDLHVCLCIFICEYRSLAKYRNSEKLLKY